MHPARDVEAHDPSTPSCQQRRRNLDGRRLAVAVHDDLRVLVARLQTVDQLLTGVPTADAIKGHLRKHPLVPVPPPQQRHGIREDLLGAHGDQPLTDALVVVADTGGNSRAGVGFLPSCLGSILALHFVHWRPGQVQHAEGLQLQELRELQQGAAGGREVRRVHEHGVAGLELGPVILQDSVSRVDHRSQADLLRREIFKDLCIDDHHILLVAGEQGAGRADRPLGRELGRLGQHEHRVLGLETLHARAHLLDAADTCHAQANARLLQLAVDHGVVHRGRQHAHQDLVVVDGLLQGPRLRLDLHGAAQRLAVGVSLGRPQDVLHGAGVVDLRRKLCGIEEVCLHEVLVGQHHCSLVTLAQPLCKAFLMRLGPSNNPVLQTHHCPLVRFLGPWLEVQPATTKTFYKLLLRRFFGATSSIIAAALLLVGQDVVRLVEQLEVLGVAPFVGVLRQNLGAELGADLMESRFSLNTDQLVVVWLRHGLGSSECTTSQQR
mmetsp:Transcript_93695/g.260848  ORF Transcript_93695/g.260848 Transcript_93695/m.260848 type:complete len:493 (+) Transcript_93695:1274-2752(+)